MQKTCVYTSQKKVTKEKEKLSFEGEKTAKLFINIIILIFHQFMIFFYNAS